MKNAERIIALPCYGITIELYEDNFEGQGRWGSGYIVSDLHEECPEELVIADDRGDGLDSDEQEMFANWKKYNATMDALESFILAAACSGVDVESDAFIEAIETTVQSCAKAWED